MATAASCTAYQQLAGTLNFLGHGCLPYTSFVASHLQQQLSKLQVAHLHMANCFCGISSNLLQSFAIHPRIRL
jgi:hypothetical protein